ncbi:MAG: tetratricopeptide repeat-containing sulfotransferase family protein [Rhodosalinus sp.]
MAADPRMEAQKIAGLLQAGKLRPAFKAARTAMKRWPREAFFANLAGLALVHDGDSRQAVGYFRKAMELNPAFPEPAQNLIQALVSLDRVETAQALLDKLLAQRPRDPELWYQQALCHMRAGLSDEAEAAASHALALAPATVKVWLLRGSLRMDRGDFRGALADCREAEKLAPQDGEVALRLSHALGALRRDAEALQAIERAANLAPTDPEVLLRHATLLNEAGRVSEAKAVLGRLLTLVPRHPDGLYELARLQSAEENRTVLPEVEAALRKTRSDRDRVLLEFAAARIHGQSGNRKAEARHIAAANAADARQRPHDFAGAQAQCERILSHFPEGTPLLEVTGGTGSGGPLPIFVLGMMRSGTTLTEQMISAHPAVFGAGELAAAARLTMPQVKGEAGFDAEEAAALARDYRAALPEMPEGTRAFVDKMPANYRLIGYLASALPEARFVHLVRDPRDVALSIWRTHFPAAAMSFTADLEAIAQMANLYRRYMARWQALFPERILDVPYADLVQDIEGWSRRIADHCGLDWVPEMAAPERNPAAVRTASVNQVRQGVHSRSVGAWRQHREALAPFLAALDPALWPELDAG